MKTLVLEKRGCDFKNHPVMDVNNHRVCGRIVDKNDRDLFLEFTHGCCYRFNNKRTGKPLKKPILEHTEKLYLDVQYDEERVIYGRTIKGSWKDLNVCRDVSSHNYLYTIDNILKVVNSLSKEPYTAIEFK